MPRSSPGRVALITLLLLSAACRTGTQPFSRYHEPRRVSRKSDVLELREISAAQVSNAHEAVLRLRPEFLRQRARPSSDQPTGAFPTVYVNGVREGGPEMLRTIPARVVMEIRYLGPTAASSQFGPFHPDGVIAVRTKR